MGAETEKNGVSGDNAYKRSAENTVKEDNKNLSVKKRRKFKWYHYVAAALLLIVIIIFVTWHFLPSKTLNVAVLDKTVLSYSQDDRIVKDTVYRKHQGFFWILNQQKYIKSSGEDYDFKKDYYGPMLDSEGNYDHSVELKSIADMPDLVYLADAYGLGNDTYGYYNGGTPEFSGVSADDMSVVTFAYENGAPVIAETTLFSAPLSESVYAQLTSMLGITPKKWLGRYIVDLQDFTDLPDWAPPMYEQQEGVEWRFTGPGILLVSSDGKIKVLEQNTDFNSKDLLRIYINEEYGGEFWGVRKCNFYNWFELVEPDYGTETIATYEFDLNATGMEKIKDISKTPRFCAVSRKQEEGHAPVYFFAGDFNDYVSGGRYGKFLFASQFFQLFSYDRQGDISNFYWNFYNPLMRKILSDTASTRYTEETKNYEEVSRVNNGKFQILEDGKWKSISLKAVAINACEPGKTMYTRDFTFYEKLIENASELGANCIVTKDLLPPEFYTAVSRFNKKEGNSKVYIMQQIAVPDGLEPEGYLTDGGLTQWKNAVETTINALHGNTSASTDKVGEATYFTDVSQYVLGISMQPQLTSETCSKALKNRNYTFSGEYAKSSKGIAGFAAYLYNTAQEISKEQYGYYTPVSVCGEINMLAGTELSDDKNEYSFSNIVNNDCEEYYFNEVRFDSEVFEATKYAKKSFSEACADVFGQVSRALKPVLISGVHSSGVNSVYSQNAVTETEQGNRLVAAVSAAKDAGCLGAAVCDLNDSWTDVSDDMKSSVAENNAMWHNTCDPAQTTGLIAMDAAQPDSPGLVLSDDDLVEGISMYSNAEYMYITLRLYEEIDFKSNAMFVGIDTYQRNDGEYYYAKDFTPISLSGMEFVLRFDGKQNAALYVIKSYDRTKGTAYTEESYSADFKKVSDLVYGGFSTGDTQFYQTGSTVYVRLPWNWLNVADPSKQLVINDKDGRSERFKTVTTNGALVSVMIGARKDGDLIYGFPADKHDPGYKVFRWSKWDTVSYNLRQKESFGLLKKYFEK